MTEYEFTFRYKLPDSLEEKIFVYEEALGEAGCTDAMLGWGNPGFVSLEFIREAKTAFGAIKSALTDIQNAIPDAIFVEASPDLVSLSDIGRYLKTSRQWVRELMNKNKTSFPVPAHIGSPSLWHFSDIIEWFKKIKNRDLVENPEIPLLSMILNKIKLCKKDIDNPFDKDEYIETLKKLT